MVIGFANNNYWSSAEKDNNNEWNQNFNNGNENNNNKNNANYVFAVRGFIQNNKRPKKNSDAFIKKAMQLTLFIKSETTFLKDGFTLEEVFKA